MTQWLIRWGQMGKAVVEARDTSEAFDVGNAYLAKTLPWCGVRDVLRITDVEAARYEGQGVQRITGGRPPARARRRP